LAVPAIVLLISPGSAFAQSGENHANDQQGKPPSATDAAKDSQRKTDEFAEAAQVINGPAGNPECVWLGRRVVRLMGVADCDPAFRPLNLYDRLGCRGGHVRAAFRCLTRSGPQTDDKVPKSLSDRFPACWINPGAQPQAAAGAAPAASATTSGSAAAQPAASPQPSASPSPAAK